MESEGSEKKEPKEDLAHVITPPFFLFVFVFIFSFSLFFVSAFWVWTQLTSCHVDHHPLWPAISPNCPFYSFLFVYLKERAAKGTP